MKHKRIPHPPVRISTHEDRARWVIQFAQMDLDTLRPGDWVNLREDIHQFAHLVPGHYQLAGKLRSATDPHTGASFLHRVSPAIAYGIHGILDGDTAVLTDDDIRAIQPRVLAWLRALTTPPEPRVARPFNFVPFQGRVDMGFEGIPFVAATAHDLFWWHLLVLILSEQPGRHILRCPECDTIFYRVQKQAYCSRTCSNRVMQKRFRERHEASTAAKA